VTTETVIRGSRAKAMLLLAGGLVFTWLFLLQLGEPDEARLWASLGVALCGVGSAIALLLIVRPAEVRLRSNGFTYRSMWKSREVAWADVESFHIWKNPRAFQSLVAWTYLPGRRPDGILTRLNAGVGAEGALPGMLTMPPKQLLALMNHHLELHRQ
jgi:hypothetical protein